MHYYYQRWAIDIFHCKAFCDQNFFFLIVQGQMNEKYYVISGKKKKCALLIITNHQRVSEVLLSFKSLHYLVLTQLSNQPLDRTSQPPPTEDKKFSTSNSNCNILNFVLGNRCLLEKGYWLQISNPDFGYQRPVAWAGKNIQYFFLCTGFISSIYLFFYLKTKLE